MSNVYINPNGLGPVYKRSSGQEYEALRNEVIQALEGLRDEKGIHPLDAVVKWEKVSSELNLPPDRTGDLVVANKAGYGWSEDLTSNLQLFTVPLETGYKQAVFADNVPGLWAPFIVVGNGIKKNHQIAKPISHIDQLPTIFKAMSLQIPSKVEGKSVDEIFK
jgi:predicted AlkP superfamily phosphohydrolase/phosphomutase